MSQNDGVNSLKRIKFEYGDTEYKFVLNPEEYIQSEPNRATITQTRGGAYLDAWGPGLVTIEIKGTTGFKNGGDADSGFKKFVELRDFIRKVYDDVVPGQKAEILMKFYNYTDEDNWYVYPLKFTLTRNKSRPLLYSYDILLQGLAKIGDYNPTEINLPNSQDGSMNPETPNMIQKDSIQPEEDDSSSEEDDSSGGDTTEEESLASKAFSFLTSDSVKNWLSDQVTKNVKYGMSVLPIPVYTVKTKSRMLNKSALFTLKNESYLAEATTELQRGVDYTYDKEIDKYVVSSIETLADNFKQLLGGSIGKVSPFVAKYITTDFNILPSGKVSNLKCVFLLDDGFFDIGYINYISAKDQEIYIKLQSFDESIIEVDSYYSYINEYLYSSSNNTIKNVSYKTLIAALLSKNYKILDSCLVASIIESNLPLNYVLMAKSILLASINIYSKLKTFLENNKKIDYSLEDLDILINNIKYFSRILENYDPELRPLNLIRLIRSLQIDVINFRGTQELFNTCSRDTY